jgi:hypothetical protein
MKLAAIILAVLSFLSGLAAAWYWYEAGRVPVGLAPRSGPGGAMPGPVRAALGGLRVSVEASAALNRNAALLTAAAVVLGTLANLIGLIASN